MYLNYLRLKRKTHRQQVLYKLLFRLVHDVTPARPETAILTEVKNVRLP